MLFKIIQRFCQKKANAVMINKMADRIQSMNKSIRKTTPRAFSLLLILSTIPTFYFSYQFCIKQYNSNQFTSATNSAIKYFYLKNIVLFSTALTLFHFQFNNPSAKFFIPRKPIKRMYLPLLASLVGLAIPEWDSADVAVPAIITDYLTMGVELKLTSQGSLPFWFYSFRHYIRFFDLITIVMVGVSLYRLNKRVQSHPYEFIA